MLEILVVLAILAAMGGWAVAAARIAAETLLVAGFWLVLGGLAFGVPAGFLYHLLLRRSLLRRGALPARWWLQPTQFNPTLPAADRRLVLGFCYAGAAGFLVSLLGCLVVGMGAWRG